MESILKMNTSSYLVGVFDSPKRLIAATTGVLEHIDTEELR